MLDPKNLRDGHEQHDVIRRAIEWQYGPAIAEAVKDEIATADAAWADYDAACPEREAAAHEAAHDATWAAFNAARAARDAGIKAAT
ncbi:MAG: hypothetical protein LBL95_03120 [Deltaproteobacteria bacterium]|jgi:hypothetical protein|nr:hypothetical protein [Deltaproteobacteria bacterium]